MRGDRCVSSQGREPTIDKTSYAMDAIASAVKHRIEVFAGGCHICDSVVAMIEVGKCASCELIVHDLTDQPSKHEARVRRYGIRAVPTVVIDGKIKVEGKPDFPWICGDDFYAWLERRYPLR